MINGIGFLVILACVFGSFIVAGGKMAVILHALPHEMVAIGGASLGAFLVANSLRTAKLAAEVSSAPSRRGRAVAEAGRGIAADQRSRPGRRGICRLRRTAGPATIFPVDGHRRSKRAGRKARTRLLPQSFPQMPRSRHLVRLSPWA